MERFVKGDIVVVPFPFSDLTNTKKRPALVLADLKGDDLILTQITSRNIYDSYAIEIEDNDIVNGSLNRTSNVRPNKIFTADNRIILYKIGSLNDTKMNEITSKIIEILTE